MTEFYTTLLAVIALLETGNGIRDNNGAIGKYQIRDIYVRDVNRIMKTNYTHEDARKERSARDMVYFYLRYYGKKMYERTGRKPTVYDLAMIHRLGPYGYTHADHDYGIRAVNLFKAMKGVGK